MLFVLSAATRFHAKPAAECVMRSTPKLASKAKALAQELRRLEAKEIRKQLNVNDALARQYEKFLSNMEGGTPVPAGVLYNSPLYETLDLATFDEDDAVWANRNLRIYSGLYGLLRPYDEIQPTSLPVSMSTKLTTSKGKFLREYWRDTITKELSEVLDKLPMPMIINCAGEADEGCYDLDGLTEYTEVTSIDFDMQGSAKQEAMGEFVRWAMENRVMTIEEILEYQGLIEEGEAATIRVSPKSTNKNKIVFEEKTADGHINWGKKLQDAGGRNALRREMGGKQRFMRTEMNKYLAKDGKGKRKKAADVY
eukprot:TRINITY_DN123706_c0_g1_i1.p1 TRINITY_DN123706_c0_g1~~TRINITY_DN123706_c0_g1_i1.p1  ORF type:complete len:310 (+),score=91.59 TRINITY_DN123706_c0_g1_i1:147-1076(+)